MEDSVVQETKRLNDKFPINYFHREKIEKLAPLRFEHVYYIQYDIFQVVETGGVFQIDNFSTPGNKDYLYHWISGPRELKPGYNTVFIGNDMHGHLFKNRDHPFDTLRILLGLKDYYHVGDILYDLSNEVEEIPDRLFNYILKICDEENSCLQR